MTPSTAFAQIGPTQQKILLSLLENPAGLPVDELITRTGVTASAVRQHIATLERDGFVRKGAVRPTGRRPQQLYELSDEGRELFPRRYGMMADQLIATVHERYGSESLTAMMRELGSNSAGDLDLTDLPEDELAEALAAVMAELGYAAVRGSSDGEPEVVAYNCVFHHLAERYPEVCEFDLALMERATGRPIDHRECMVRGGGVCRFRLKEPVDE